MENLDLPKSLKSPIEQHNRMAMIGEPHVARLNGLVRETRERRRLDKDVPFFDPFAGGADAMCLYLLAAPGPKAVKSGFVSRNNPDTSAKNFIELNTEAAIPWNKARIAEPHVRAVRPSVESFHCSHPSPMNLNTNPENRGRILSALQGVAKRVQEIGESPL